MTNPDDEVKKSVTQKQLNISWSSSMHIYDKLWNLKRKSNSQTRRIFDYLGQLFGKFKYILKTRKTSPVFKNLNHLINFSTSNIFHFIIHHVIVLLMFVFVIQVFISSTRTHLGDVYAQVFILTIFTLCDPKYKSCSVHRLLHTLLRLLFTIISGGLRFNIGIICLL